MSHAVCEQGQWGRISRALTGHPGLGWLDRLFDGASCEALLVPARFEVLAATRPRDGNALVLFRAPETRVDFGIRVDDRLLPGKACCFTAAGLPAFEELTYGADGRFALPSALAAGADLPTQTALDRINAVLTLQRQHGLPFSYGHAASIKPF